MEENFRDPLLAAWLAKDRNTFFGLLYDRYAERILAMAWRYLPALDQAVKPEDILMDVFAKLMKKGLDLFDPDRFDKIGGLVFTTTRFVILNSCRKRRTIVRSHETSQSPAGSENDTLLIEFSDYLEDLLLQLPPVKRAVFELRLLHYTHEEIAEMLAITVSNSRFHYSSAKKILRKLIDDTNNRGHSSA